MEDGDYYLIIVLSNISFILLDILVEKKDEKIVSQNINTNFPVINSKTKQEENDLVICSNFLDRKRFAQ